MLCLKLEAKRVGSCGIMFIFSRETSQIYPTVKSVLVRFLLHQNAEVHKIPPAKQDIKEKIIACFHYVTRNCSYSLTVRTRSTSRFAFGGCSEESAKFALHSSERFRHRCLLAVPRGGKQREMDLQHIPGRKGIPLLQTTDLRVRRIAALWRMST